MTRRKAADQVLTWIDCDPVPIEAEDIFVAIAELLTSENEWS